MALGGYTYTNSGTVPQTLPVSLMYIHVHSERRTILATVQWQRIR